MSPSEAATLRLATIIRAHQLIGLKLHDQEDGAIGLAVCACGEEIRVYAVDHLELEQHVARKFFEYEEAVK